MVRSCIIRVALISASVLAWRLFPQGFIIIQNLVLLVKDFRLINCGDSGSVLCRAPEAFLEGSAIIRNYPPRVKRRFPLPRLAIRVDNENGAADQTRRPVFHANYGALVAVAAAPPAAGAGSGFLISV
jgi:hypothetical protein